MSQHFELKVPGGKLVVVDVDTDGDTITNVKISGDFFIEPDEAVKSDGVVFLPFVETSSVMASGTGTCLVL